MDGRRRLCPMWCALLALVARCVPVAADAERQTKRTDWCEITVPEGVKAGEKVEIRVKLSGLEGKAFLSCDLKDQSNRMVKWGGPPREIEEGGEITWSLMVRDVPGLESVHALVFATRAKDDGWEKAVAQATSPDVKITGRSPLLDLTYKKSWIYVDASNDGKQLVSGDRWDVAVDYYLDPADHYQKTTLYIWGTGPWIDTPDGKYTTKRGHIGYRGLGGRVDLTKPGSGRHVFTFTVPPGLELVKKNNRVLLITSFRDAAGQSWPWHHRANNRFIRKRGFFEIETEVPGGLFTYDEPVQIAIRLKNVDNPGEKKALRYTVHDTTGGLAAEGQKEFTVERDGQRVTLDLDLERRGVFLVELEVAGWEKRHTTFARIPDLRAVTGGTPTRFGMTNHWGAPHEEAWAVAQRLGLSTCRRFTRWYRVQPGPDVYKLDDLERELDAARKHGVAVWLCVVDPPPFAFRGKPEPPGYRAFDFEEQVWRDFVRTVTTRLNGKILGWEWLNEITPGGCEDPVGTYVKMCQIGTDTVKAINPDLLRLPPGEPAQRSELLALPELRLLPVLLPPGGAVHAH